MGKENDAYILNFQKSEVEGARLDAQHEVIKHGMMGGNLFDHYIPTKGVQFNSIADVGCGTGVWLNDVARTFFAERKENDPPTLIGFDVDARRFASNTMPGVELIKHDCAEPFDAKYHEKFDVVNIRLLAHAVPEEGLVRIVRNSCQLLRKGGYFQWLDSDIKYWKESRVLPEFPRIMQAIQAERLERRYVPDIHHFMLSELLNVGLPTSGNKDIGITSIISFRLIPMGMVSEDKKQLSEWDFQFGKFCMKGVQLFLQAALLRKKEAMSSGAIGSDGETSSQEIAELERYESLVTQALAGDEYQMSAVVPFVIARRGMED